MHDLHHIVRRLVIACLSSLVSMVGLESLGPVCGSRVLVCAASAEPTRRDDEVLRQATWSLDQWLGSSENSRRWKQYLRVEELSAELSREGEPDADKLAEIAARFGAGHAGLEQDPFLRVRRALNTWLDRQGRLKADELPAQARREKERFRPLSASLLEASRGRLQAAARQLDHYLRALGSNGQRWKSYLKWDSFEEQLARGNEADLDSLVRTYRRLVEDHPGLELGPFQDTAAALELHIDRLAAASGPDIPAKFATEMENLASLLQTYPHDPTDEASQQIADRLAWLEAIGAAPRTVRSARAVYGQPNVYASVSSQLVGAGLARPIERTDPLIDTILGTRVRGTTHTSAHVHGRLIPSRQGAAIETVLAGIADSTSVGRNGPATIYSDSRTQLSARKRLMFDEYGIHVEPATSHASTRSVGRGIHVDVRCLKRIAHRIASRRVAEQRGLADAIASRHAEDRINVRFDDESAERVATANGRYLARVRLPLVRRREFPRHVRVSSSSEQMQIELTQSNRFQLAAPSAPPPQNGPSDLSLRLHQSWVNNLAQALLAGRTFTEEAVQKEAIEIYGELPEKLRPDPEDEPWSISLAARRPVTIEFLDRRLDVTVRGSRYTSGEREFSSMNVRAIYQLERTERGAKLVRQGDLEILPPGFDPTKDRLSASQVALRRLLSKRFGKLLEPTIETHGLELPGEWKKVGRLKLDRLDADAGWLALAWTLPASK
jgi:hypothetical protein